LPARTTRQTQKLLSHYGIQTRMVSYHEHNEMTKAAELIVNLETGAKIAARPPTPACPASPTPDFA